MLDLHVRGFVPGGYSLMIGNKAVSIHEALLLNGKPFHKATINALNRRNMANENDLEAFEKAVKILHTGLDAYNARVVLYHKFNIDVLSREYYDLTQSEIYDLKKVYAICKYNVTVKNRKHSLMYYFFHYLSTKDLNI